jgi:hypothetical protein
MEGIHGDLKKWFYEWLKFGWDYEDMYWDSKACRMREAKTGRFIRSKVYHQFLNRFEEIMGARGGRGVSRGAEVEGLSPLSPSPRDSGATGAMIPKKRR